MEAVGLLTASEEEKRQCYKDNVGRMNCQFSGKVFIKKHLEDAEKEVNLTCDAETE